MLNGKYPEKISKQLAGIKEWHRKWRR